LPPIRGAGVVEQMGNKRKLPKSKTLISKKTTILPPKTGFSIVKKMTKS